MFSNLFTSSPAMWTGLICGMIALPILIHLINRVRHKTIEWAAMEFLLKSHRKNRNWVWLKQMLLLLSRIAILLLGLFLLSQVGCENDRVAALMGGRATHHYVLVDDSFSMSDRDNQGSAMDRAKTTVRQIISRARSRSNHRLSLLRTSAVSLDSDQSTRLLGFDIDSEQVDSSFARRTEAVVTGMMPSNFSLSPEESLDSISQLVNSRNDENAIVYLLSDFREKDWPPENPVSKALKSIADAGAGTELIRCAKSLHSNLAITQLQPLGNVRVAQTPLMMEVTVTNFSDQSANKVQVNVASSVFSRGSPGSDESSVETEELPTVFIESIEAGQSETRRFPVWFAEPGQHGVKATIGDDAVAADNVRHCAVEVKAEASVLLIDQPSRLNADFLALAINPNNMTGIRADIQMADFLRSSTAETLLHYDVIFLCDPGQIDETGIKNLRQYVSNGGGLVYFGGPNTNFVFFNHYFCENGEGLLPVELAEAEEVADREDDTPADIIAEKHPIFAPVNDVRNSLLDLVQVKQILRPGFSWLQNPPPQTKVIATLRGDRQYPLIVESSYGKGRTMMVMTTAGAQWNNWMRNATFPPILLLLEDHLAAGRYLSNVDLVGEAISFVKPTGSVTPDVTLLSPAAGDERIESRIRLESTDQGLVGSIGESLSSKVNRGTSVPGFYELWFRQMDSSSSVDRIGVNVDTQESELLLIGDEKLAQSLDSDSTKISSWDQFDPEPERKPDSTLHRILLVLLFLFLIAEQTLAWMCSYH